MGTCAGERGSVRAEEARPWRIGVTFVKGMMFDLGVARGLHSGGRNSLG